MELDEDGRQIDENSAEGIKRRYAREAKEKELKGKQKQNESRGDGAGAGTAKGAAKKIKSIISASFDPYMMSYILLERKNMKVSGYSVGIVWA